MAGANRVVIDGVSYPIDDATAVDFEEQQTLTDAQKAQARSNISAASQDDMTSVQNAVGNVPSWSNLQDEVADLKSALEVAGVSISHASDKAIGNAFLTFTPNAFYSTDAVGTESAGVKANKDYMYASCPCSVGDQFSIRVYGTYSSHRAWAFLDSNGYVTRRSTRVDNITEDVITAESGEVMFVINNRIANCPDYYAFKGTSFKTAVETALAGKQNTLTFDNTPTENSSNPVKSGGVYSAIQSENTLETREFTKYRSTINLLHDITLITDWTRGKAYATGGTINVLSPATASSLQCAYYACIQGDKFTCKCGGTSSYKPWAFINAEGTVLDVSSNNSPGLIVITAPKDAAYVVFNTQTSGQFMACKGVAILPDDFAGFNFKGANVAIIGDSISTNGHYSAENPLGNVPEIVVQAEDVGIELSAYATYYDVGVTVGGHEITESDVGTEITFTPTADDVGKMIGKPANQNSASVVTWWEVAQSILGFNPIPVCWSGSSITDHEENDQSSGHYIYKCAHSFHPSQIRKCGIRTPGTMTRTAPDMIIIYRGTNDLSHEPYAHITDYLDGYPTEYPVNDTYDVSGVTNYDYAKGIRLLISKLRDAYPDACIVLCTLNYFRRLSTTAKFTDNGTDNWQKYNAMIRRLAEYEGCGLIEFDLDGLTWSNAAEGYYQEGRSNTAKWTHPNTTGHKILGNRALMDLVKINKLT